MAHKVKRHTRKDGTVVKAHVRGAFQTHNKAGKEYQHKLREMSVNKSSFIESLTYNEDHKMLKVQMKEGDSYQYDGVSLEQAKSMGSGNTSRGRFYNKNIRGKFGGKKLSGKRK